LEVDGSASFGLIERVLTFGSGREGAEAHAAEWRQQEVP
jgi:hypothetical protein